MLETQVMIRYLKNQRKKHQKKLLRPYMAGTVLPSSKAFEKAIAIADRVITAEMQGGGNFNSAIST